MDTTPSAADWQKFVRRFLLALAVMLAGVAALNGIVNPLALYPTHIFAPVVWSSRSEKMEMLKESPADKRVLVLGSSRSMKIAPAEVERYIHEPVFNAAVDSAMMEDYYAMLRYAVEKAHAPVDTVIVGLDVEAFHNNSSFDDRLQASPELMSLLGKGGLQFYWRSFTKAFEMQQTSLSIHSVLSTMHGRAANTSHFEPDGYLRYDELEQERSTGHYDLEAKIAATKVEYDRRFRGYTAVSEERLGYLEKTLQYCKDHRIRVIVFITPVHPQIATTLAAYAPLHQQVRKKVGQLCEQYHVRLQDYGDIAAFGGDPEFFYDGAHVDERNASRLVSVLFQRTSSAVQ